MFKCSTVHVHWDVNLCVLWVCKLKEDTPTSVSLRHVQPVWEWECVCVRVRVPVHINEWVSV